MFPAPRVSTVAFSLSHTAVAPGFLVKPVPSMCLALSRSTSVSRMSAHLHSHPPIHLQYSVQDGLPKHSRAASSGCPIPAPSLGTQGEPGSRALRRDGTLCLLVKCKKRPGDLPSNGAVPFWLPVLITPLALCFVTCGSVGTGMATMACCEDSVDLPQPRSPLTVRPPRMVHNWGTRSRGALGHSAEPCPGPLPPPPWPAPLTCGGGRCTAHRSPLSLARCLPRTHPRCANVGAGAPGKCFSLELMSAPCPGAAAALQNLLAVTFRACQDALWASHQPCPAAAGNQPKNAIFWWWK